MQAIGLERSDIDQWSIRVKLVILEVVKWLGILRYTIAES